MNPLKKEGLKIYLNEGFAVTNGHAAQPDTILPDLITPLWCCHTFVHSNLDTAVGQVYIMVNQITILSLFFSLIRAS